MALYPPTSEVFDTWINNKPESKLELIDGQLVVGNSLIGSRLLLRQILQGWRADAAVAIKCQLLCEAGGGVGRGPR